MDARSSGKDSIETLFFSTSAKGACGYDFPSYTKMLIADIFYCLAGSVLQLPWRFHEGS